LRLSGRNQGVNEHHQRQNGWENCSDHNCYSIRIRACSSINSIVTCG
jgi:hypothetical protein